MTEDNCMAAYTDSTSKKWYVAFYEDNIRGQVVKIGILVLLSVLISELSDFLTYDIKVSESRNVVVVINKKTSSMCFYVPDYSMNRVRSIGC